MASETFNLFGVLNTSTGKLVNDITNPKHKFWEKKGSCETALKTYKNRHSYRDDLDNLKVVTIKCTVQEN